MGRAKNQTNNIEVIIKCLPIHNMRVLVTGCLGLVGSYSAKALSDASIEIIGIDADVRSQLFDDVARLDDNQARKLAGDLGISKFYQFDIRDQENINDLVMTESDTGLDAIIHCAAQPSHDWAAKDPLMDLTINLNGTINLLEALRKYNKSCLFIHLSTNKVYGDLPNRLPLIESPSRYEIDTTHPYFQGIDESMSIDQSMHSLFGCSKASADLYVQEYARYFSIPTIILRGGCLTGAKHRGGKLHGFMNYLLRTALEKRHYEVIGYKGKQVRDNLSGKDIARLFLKIIEAHSLNPKKFTYPIVANMGGGRSNAVSILELKSLLKNNFELNLQLDFNDIARLGDHKWYITDNSLLNVLYDWTPKESIIDIISEMIEYL